MRLVGTYHGFRMCVFGPHSFEARDKAKGNRGGRVGVRLVVSIRPSVPFQAPYFLLV